MSPPRPSDDTVPIFSALEQLYRMPETQTERWENLKRSFHSRFGRQPEFIVRCPGRVNIIGEHIDYSLYEVLPMAIIGDILIAVARKDEYDIPTSAASEHQIELANTNNAQFPSRTISITRSGSVEIDPTLFEWSNYFKAGFRGALEILGDRPTGTTFYALVDGTVPTGSGLSSSSALVCASALATLAVNGVWEVPKVELVEAAIVAERHNGVSSGGMDQAASILSQAGSALYVQFAPTLRTSPVPFPATDPDVVFLTAQTFVTANKHETGSINYNLRVTECTMAAAVLLKLLKLNGELPPDKSPLGLSLSGFHNAYFENHGDPEEEEEQSGRESTIEKAIWQLQVLRELAETHLSQQEGYTLQEVASILEITPAEAEARFCRRFPVKTDLFKLRQRAIHVFSEARRVKLFYHLLMSSNAADKRPQSEDLLLRLGELMNDSQTSCRVLYNNSVPEIDLLCDIARKEGSYGSRLTGAGFGGSTVHLVPKHKVESIKGAWLAEYYSKQWPESAQADLEHWRGAVVVSEPENGASILRL